MFFENDHSTKVDVFSIVIKIITSVNIFENIEVKIIFEKGYLLNF